MLVKYINRRFTLFEHSFLCDILFPVIQETPFAIGECIDIYRDGFLDCFVNEEYITNGKNHVENLLREDSTLPHKIIADINAWNEQMSLFVKEEKDIVDNKSLLLFFKKVLLESRKFSINIELTHHIGRSTSQLTNEEIEGLGKANDKRNIIFYQLFEVLNSVNKKIATNFGVNTPFTFLSCQDLISLLSDEISVENALTLQKNRENKCIFYPLTNVVIDQFGFNDEFNKIKNDFLDESHEEIKGLSVIEKNVRGEVQVITQRTPLEQILPGKILVVAMTLPSMTPALKKSLGIVTDEGGRLCHAAVVAREFEIPCIVGTKIATKVLKDGDLVEVDANTGVVRKI